MVRCPQTFSHIAYVRQISPLETPRSQQVLLRLITKIPGIGGLTP